jgi:hypothetical protein
MGCAIAQWSKSKPSLFQAAFSSNSLFIADDGRRFGSRRGAATKALQLAWARLTTGIAGTSPWIGAEQLFLGVHSICDFLIVNQLTGIATL